MRFLNEGWLFGVMLCLHALLLGYGAAVHSPGFDELGHLPAGISHWKLANTDLYRVNPPLVRMLATLPLSGIDFEMQFMFAANSTLERPEFDLGRQLWSRHGRNAFWYLTLARWSLIPLSLIAALVIYRWSRSLYGGRSGLFAAALWCFSPLVIANAQMITPDAGAAALGVLAAYVFWQWLQEQTYDMALCAGATLGLAQLSKFTWIILFVLWPVCWLVYSWTVANRLTKPAFLQATLIAIVCLFVINCGYGFEGTLKRLGDYRFVSRPLSGHVNELGDLRQIEGNRFAGNWLGSVPVPLPSNYVLGIDRQKLDFERKSMSYLRGEWRERGWWYYYIYGLAIKEPLCYLVVFALALWATLRRRKVGSNELFLLCPAAILFVFVSSQTGFSRHIRYVLPILPFLYVWMGQLWGCDVWSSSKMRKLAAAMLVGGVIPSLYVFPHSHAYFNLLVGGSQKGGEHLAGSNLDWGQDLLLLARWKKLHPAVKIDGVAYSLSPYIDLSLLGLPTQSPPSNGPRPGVWVVFAGQLRQEHHQYDYFLAFKPTAVLGYTVYIYRLSQSDVDAYWKAQVSIDTSLIGSESNALVRRNGE